LESRFEYWQTQLVKALAYNSEIDNFTCVIYKWKSAQVSSLLGLLCKLHK
jgi:hypothetical protein